MARTPAQRGAFGRWLTEVRSARFPERQADALEAMRRIAGLVISPSEYAQWESGSRVPRPDNPKVARLYEFFGSRPSDEESAPESADAGVLEAVKLLVEELRAERAERVAFQEGLLGALQELARAARRQADPEPELPEGAPR